MGVNSFQFLFFRFDAVSPNEATVRSDGRFRGDVILSDF